MHIADIRKDYRLQTLDEAGVAADPIQQFGIWWQEALQSEIVEVNAMTLATANEQGVPSARIVLLKGYDERGFNPDLRAVASVPGLLHKARSSAAGR